MGVTLGEMPKRFKKVKGGEWVQPVPEGYFMKCCDCGLVHRMNFRIVDGKVQFQAFRVDAEEGK